MELFDLRKCFEIRSQLPKTDEPFIIDQIAIDSRRISSKNALFVALSGLHFDGHDFIKQAYKAGAKICIVKTGISLNAIPKNMHCIAVKDPLATLQRLAKIYRSERNAKIIAITGSHGKTMLKDLLYHLLSPTFNTYASPESFNSQLGVALSLFQIRNEHDIALIEAGISQVREMETLAHTICPDHTIITNIKDAHIASLGTREKTAEEKCKLLQEIPRNNWCLIPSEKLLLPFLPQRAQCFTWDLSHPQLPHIYPHTFKNSYEISYPNGLTLQGEIRGELSYIFELMQIAVKASHLLHLPTQILTEQLATYTPEPMRIEVWKAQCGATIINDTYCQDPMSCDLALKQLDSEMTPNGRRIFLFSGFKVPSHQPAIDMQRIAHAVAKHQVDLCILSHQPHLSQLIAAISLLSPRSEIIVKKSFDETLFYLRNDLQAGDTLVIKGSRKKSVHEVIRILDESLPNNQVIINLAAIQSNIELIRTKLRRGTRLMVMVKALAYGTDDVRIAKFLKNIGIDILGVSYVDEGVTMRQAGVTQDIFVLNAAEYETYKAIKWNLEIGVSEASIIHSIQHHAALMQKQIKVHLHVNTGMNRFGCKPQDALKLAQEIVACKNLLFEGIMTHFAAADNPDEDDFTMQQAEILKKITQQLIENNISIPWIHASNSSASIRFGFEQCNMVRIGLAAYGLHASTASKSLIELKPAISLVSRIVGINYCEQGETISYGRKHTVTQSHARIAVLPIGYFDGLHRNYSNKGSVMIRGELAPMVGRICMDYMMVDVTHIPSTQVGDQVLIFGEDETGHYLSPEKLAEQGDSIVHELMTCLGPRIRRLFIYDEALRPR